MRKYLIPISILIVVGFFVYSFNLNNGLFWDDDDWIVNNPFVHSLSWTNIKFWFSNDILAGIGLKSNYYRPFLFFTFAFNYAISGIKPLGFHLLSNFIHLFNGILVFLLLNGVLMRRRKEEDIQKNKFSLVAFLVALVFIVHPLQTEAVTYIAGRGDPLNVFFMLLALFLFIGAEENKLSWTNWQRPLSLFVLILALLSRETAIIFPFLLMTFYISFISRSRFLISIKKAFLKALPYFGIVFIYGILRLTVLNFINLLNFYNISNVYSENLHVRMFTFFHTLLAYLKLLIVPVGLHMERSRPVHLSLLEWPVWASFLGLLGVLGWLIFLYKKERLRAQAGISDSRLSNFRVWFFGVLWFFIAMAPASGITPINALIYEHWLYLPMVGFFFILLFYFNEVLNFLKSKGKVLAYWVLVVGFIGYISFYGFQAIKRNMLWGNPAAFYQDVLRYEPDSVRINNNLGNIYFNEGNMDKAEEFYRNAVASEDIFAQPHFNIGAILQARGDIAGAIAEYEKALEINEFFPFAYQNLIIIYANSGDIVKAIEYGERLQQIKPRDPRVYYNLALLYVAQGNQDKVLENLFRGLDFADSDPETKQAILELLGPLEK